MNRPPCFLRMAAMLPVALARNAVPPVPPVTPVAPVTPAAPRFRWIDEDQIREQAEMAREQAEAVREQAETIRQQAQEAAREAREMAMADFAGGIRRSFAFAPQPMPRPADRGDRGRRDDDRNYERGQKALDGRRWDEALELFSQV